ncbi:MAG TPA: hypothetical protein VLE27_05550 [Thermoanaerobaculia bacterium]|nr:hypothetical protein [Thermoanaerobaculia bacterium]
MRTRFVRLTLAAALLVLGFASTSSATHTCVITSNFCSSCAGGKIKSCDRYRCGDSTTGYTYFTECTACANYC